MVKSSSDRVFISTTVLSPDGTKKSVPDYTPDGTPPQVPPRMKKKGPALPEKPPHLRAKSTPSSQAPREPLKPRPLPSTNIDRYLGTHREVLVAASKAVRERPVEKRQREPAKLLMPTFQGAPTKEVVILPPKTSPSLEDRLAPSKKTPSDSPGKGTRKQSRPPQPVLLIPRGMLPWGGTSPVSYALWMQREAAAPPPKGAASGRREPVKQQQHPLRLDQPSSTSSARARSGSVTRSGSLTSQGSSSSDSGNETFPKSVLKKQKRSTPNSTSKGSCRKMEHKKNVTFNAFATVQLMEA